MALKRLVLQLGMGTDIHGQDSTKAAERAVRDALWRNYLTIADALKQPRDAMDIEVTIGVPRPATVDASAIAAVFPYGTAHVTAVDGGLEIPAHQGNDGTLIAHAAVMVRMRVPEGGAP